MRFRNIFALALIALLVAIPVAFACDGGPHQSGGGGGGNCISTLPVTHSFKSVYSASHTGKRTMRLEVMSAGSPIHHLKAEVYTFGGELVAKSRLYKRTFKRSKTVSLKLRYRGMQIGKYTLVISGEPNHSRSCGPKKYTKVVEFYGCPKGLPVDFPNPPGGNASDYGQWLTVTLQPTGAVLRNVIVELYDFENNLFGRKRVGALFGTAEVPIPLKHKLVNGGYTVVVTAPGSIPRVCGSDVEATKVLRFGTGSNTGGTQDGGGDQAGGEEVPGEDDFGTEEWGGDDSVDEGTEA